MREREGGKGAEEASEDIEFQNSVSRGGGGDEISAEWRTTRRTPQFSPFIPRPSVSVVRFSRCAFSERRTRIKKRAFAAAAATGGTRCGTEGGSY